LIRDRDGAVGDVMAVPVPGGLHHHYVGQLSRESPETRTRWRSEVDSKSRVRLLARKRPIFYMARIRFWEAAASLIRFRGSDSRAPRPRAATRKAGR